MSEACFEGESKRQWGSDGDLKIRLTNNSGLIKEADWGFSWKTLIFGAFVPLLRGDLAWFFIGTFLAVCTFGFAWLVFPFYYNKIFVKKLLAQGFYPADELSRMTLVNANIIRDQGGIPRTEFKAPQPATIPSAPVETIGSTAGGTVPAAAPLVSPISAAAEPTGWTCGSCMTENAPENRFCFSCGREREKPKPVCPQCGKENQLGMKFCPSCGTVLPSQAENAGSERKPEDLSVGVVQATPAVSSHQPPAPAAPQTAAPSQASFPVAAIAVVLGIGLLILVTAKSDVLLSFFKRPSAAVTASQESPPVQAQEEPQPPIPAVHTTVPGNLLRFPAAGQISASNVNMRAGHSILAQRIATLPRGQNVAVLDSWVSESDQEAILKMDLYVEINGRTKTLGKGKAVSLVQYDASQGTYLVSLQDKSGTISGWTSAENVKTLKGSIWYKVSTPGGKTGWVLGEFLSIQR
jgi:hypothetical protein